MSFPELAVNCVLIGHLDDNEYLTVDSATLLHCPSNDDSEIYSDNVEAHLCLAAGILCSQSCSLSAVRTETVILQLASLLKQLLLVRLDTQSATCHSGMYHRGRTSR